MASLRFGLLAEAFDLCFSRPNFLGFAKNPIGLDQALPAFKIIRIVFHAIGEALDHAVDHLGSL